MIYQIRPNIAEVILGIIGRDAGRVYCTAICSGDIISEGKGLWRRMMHKTQVKRNSDIHGDRKSNIYFLLFLVTIIGLVTSFAIGQALVTTKYNEVQFTMSLIVKNIEMRLDSAKAITELAAKMPPVARHDSVKAEQYLNNIISENPKMWSHFLITDENGTEIAHTEGSVHYGKSLAERDYYLVPWNEGKSIVAQPIHSVSTGRKIIAIGVPTYQDGKANGVLVGFIHLEYVSSILNENDFSKNSYLFMTNHDGTISAHVNEDYVLAKNIDDLANGHKLLQRIKDFESHIELGELEGRFGLISTAPIDTYKLSISSFIPFYEALVSPLIVTGVLLAIFISIILLLLLWIKAEKFAAYGKKMEKTANTDKLTGLKNRHWLDSIRLDTCCDEFLTLIFLDVDNFKMYNDNHNHAYGDDVLKFVGQSLINSTRPNSDICVRFAGDEFIVLLKDTPISSAVPIAERLMEALKTYAAEDLADPIYISCGIASAKKGEMTLEELIAKADDSTYEAKRSGKNTIAISHIHLH